MSLQIDVLRARKLEREKKRKNGAKLIKSDRPTQCGPFRNVVPPPRIPSGFESDIFGARDGAYEWNKLYNGIYDDRCVSVDGNVFCCQSKVSARWCSATACYQFPMDTPGSTNTSFVTFY